MYHRQNPFKLIKCIVAEYNKPTSHLEAINDVRYQEHLYSSSNLQGHSSCWESPTTTISPAFSVIGSSEAEGNSYNLLVRVQSNTVSQDSAR
jgi:hypothetical protein